MSNRTFVVHSPLGEQLEFRSMEGTEQISRLFELRVRLLSDSPSISAKSLLGKDMSVEVDLTTGVGSFRYGCIRCFVCCVLGAFAGPGAYRQT